MTREGQSVERLLSLDTLRGFDMFWIMGGDALFRALGAASGWGWARWWAGQLDHAQWAGFHFYDLIFPMFMFISGIAIPYSLLARAEAGAPKSRLYLKLARRALLLVLLGLVYNGLLQLDFGALRYPSVLGQIGLAYFFASVILLNVKSSSGRLAILGALLAGYAAVQLFFPVPGIGAGVLTPEGTINGYLDRLILPGRLYDGIFDPEGILCIVSATAITLLGGITGAFLRGERPGKKAKALLLLLSGLLLLAAGLVVKPWYPPIKKAWTSTFNLLAGGCSLLLFGLFYLVIDVWAFRRWTYFFRVIGLNSITIYLGMELIDFSFTGNALFGGLARLCGRYHDMVLAAGIIMVSWLLLHFLYRKKIFLRV